MNYVTDALASRKSKLRCAIIINCLSQGGAQQGLLRFIQEADKGAIEATVFSLLPIRTLEEPLIRAGARVEVFNIRKPMEFLRLLFAVRSFKPDLIHGRMYQSAMVATIAHFFCGRRSKLIWGIHHSINALAEESFSMRASIALMRFISRYPSAIHFVSSRSLREHIEKGFTSKSSVLIPNGIDLNEFRKCHSARERIRAQLGISTDSLVIGHVGRWAEMKDYPTLFRAFALLLKRRPETVFLMIGDGLNMGNPEFCSLADQHGIAPAIAGLGRRTDIANLMNAMDIFVLSSSRGEAFPNVLVEALSTGLMCVATDVGDCANIIRQFGRVVPTCDPERLSNALYEIAGTSPDKRAQLAVEASKYIGEHYSIQTTCRQLLNLYRYA